MNIKVEIKKIFKGERPVKAFADVVIDGSMVSHGVAVIEKDSNKLVSMPYKKWKTGEGELRRSDIAHPITTETRKQISDAVLAAYEIATDEKFN